MATYKILETGNHISASAEFMQINYPPDRYELVPEVVEPKPTHTRQFSPRELYNSFTADEIILAKTSANPAIVAQAELLAEGRDVRINVSDAGYQSTVDLFEAEGVITATRASDYRQGIPLNPIPEPELEA